MAKKSIRPTRTSNTPSAFEEARDELFQHIMRCGVVGAEPDDQKAWFDETLAYMTERFHELNADHMAQLRMLGERFAQPPKKRDAESAA
jgi:hypothetical protein